MKIRWVWIVAAAAADEIRQLHRVAAHLRRKQADEDAGDDNDEDDDADGPDAPDVPEAADDDASAADPEPAGAVSGDDSDREVLKEEKRAEKELVEDEEEQWESRREAILEGRATVPETTSSKDGRTAQYSPSQILATASLEETTEATEKLQKKEHALLKEQNDVLAKQMKVEQRQSLLAKAAAELALRQHKVKMERDAAARQMRTLKMKAGVVRSELSSVFESERVIEAAELEAKARKLLSATPAPADNSTLGADQGADTEGDEAAEVVPVKGKPAADASVSTLESEVKDLRHRLEASEARARALSDHARASEPAAWQRTMFLGNGGASQQLQRRPDGSLRVAHKPIQIIPDEVDHSDAADVSEAPVPFTASVA
mmetsp:Transcript_59724/g.159832  ORF Transcript_59724/g.159832 Transcript_59724/m.159832 type:complete len:375 (+) Transcript_59724:72-1196(+)